jgi:hypothetical protein
MAPKRKAADPAVERKIKVKKEEDGAPDVKVDVKNEPLPLPTLTRDERTALLNAVKVLAGVPWRLDTAYPRT